MVTIYIYAVAVTGTLQKVCLQLEKLKVHSIHIVNNVTLTTHQCQ